MGGPDTSNRPTSMPSRRVTSRLTRRVLLRCATVLGLVPPTAHAVRAASGAGATLPANVIDARAQSSGTTLVIALSGSPSDLDPHAANDYRSSLASRGAYEQLIALKADKTDEYEGLIAEKWEANEDKSIWTFHLRPGVTFHDGSPCDAEAVRASFERMFAVGMGPATELGRFITDPAQVTAPDPATVIFNLGRPQPLFEAGLSSQYGGQIVNAKLAKTHDEDGDWGRAWAQLKNEEGLGTGPYRIVEFEPEEQLILERYEAHWRGWDGDHFDRVVVRVVPEIETRRQLIEQGEVDITEDLTRKRFRRWSRAPA